MGALGDLRQRCMVDAPGAGGFAQAPQEGECVERPLAKGGTARRSRGPVKALASGVGRVMHALLVVGIALLVLGGVLGVGVAWRLSQGPIDLAWAARRIEAAVNKPDSPSVLQLGAASVSWAGFATGPRRGLELQLHDVRVVDRATGHVTSAGKLEMTLSMRRLVLGEVIPLAVSASGLELHLVRGADRGIELDFGGMDLGGGDKSGASLTDSVAELARPPRSQGNPAPPSLQHLEQLRRIRLERSTVVLDDPLLGTAWRLDLGALDLERPDRGGVRGTATATVAQGAARATIAMQAQIRPDGGTDIQLQLAPIAAAAVQKEATEQGAIDGAGLNGLDAAVQAAATLTLSPELLPTNASLHAEAGGGTMRIAGGSVGFESLGLDGTAHWARPGWTRPSSLELGRARAVLHAPGGAWPTTVDVKGQLGELGERLAGRVEASVDHLAFADIASLWPVRLSGHTRPWITQNLTAGTARDGVLKVGFETAADLSGLVVKSIDGSLVGDDVTIWWFRPAPPVEHAQALMTIKSPESLDIAVSSARQGPTQLSNGTVRITGLNVKDQFLALTADAAGQAADLIALLKHPRLGLLDRRPIPMRNPGGSFGGRLVVNLPLNEDLRIEQVTIQAQSHFSELRLGGLVAGHDLDHGDIQLDATQDGLKAGGRAVIGGIPSELLVEMMFTGSGATQVVERARASATASAAQLLGAGLDPGGLITGGTGVFTATYTQRRDASADLQVSADLRQAALALVGWRKAAGLAASAQAHLLLRNDRLVGVDQLAASGPGMAIEGHAELVGERPLNLVLDRIVLGPTQARGTIRFPAAVREPIRAMLVGTVLDLSTQFTGKGGEAAGTPWVADIRFDRVLLAQERSIGGVVAHAEDDGRHVAALRLSTSGAERIEAEIRAENTVQGPGRRVLVRSADAGAVLRALDVIDSVQGGRLTLDARYDDRGADPPLAGSVEIVDFHVRGAPVLGKLLQAVTIYGVVDALSGPGLAFSDLVMPFRYGGSVLDVTDVRAFSASLGLTARGRIDQGRQTIDVRGTIVPVYVFNSLLGRIPVLGRLFSNERGGGLIAVDYSVRGATASPQITANPLSALTPGFLRGLFHILE